jgi:hypothetical protein
MKKILQERFGNTKVMLEYDAVHGWIHADWVGVHSLHSIRKGTEAIVDMFRQTRCTKYLSDNTNLIGSYDDAQDYLLHTFTPQAMAAGMRHVAHVLAPGIYAKKSMEAMVPDLESVLDLAIFDNLAEAKAWLTNR